MRDANSWTEAFRNIWTRHSSPDFDSQQESLDAAGCGEKGSAMKLSNIPRALTIQEWAVVVVIIVVLLALLVPSVRWVADGERSHPVRVFVFDAANDGPIEGAQVTIFRAAPLSSMETLSKPLKGIATDRFGETEAAITASDGCAVLNNRFRTSTSSRRPTPHMHLGWAWVEVRAEGYGGAVVPVRHESRPTADVLQEPELLVPIGLLPVRREILTDIRASPRPDTM